MTQLLISVKNVEEALLALEAGADIIDLKDPNVGALGALDLHETKRIVRAINERVTLSATAGENHASLDELIVSVQARALLGVDIIKISASALFYQCDFVQKMQSFSHRGIKLIAVFFADEKMDFGLLETIKQAGFFGAMLDTKNKQKNLLQVQSNDSLQIFTHLCGQYQLQSGLAGSLRPQHIDILAKFNPTYIGFRGGVCENLNRISDLSYVKICKVRNMLQNDNKNNEKAQRILHLALHS
jgi:(5-formylfuran-3-yl)methyl phosphate synthase